MGRREGESEALDRLLRQPTRGLARDMSEMVVKDDFDRGLRRMGGIEDYEELNEIRSCSGVP